VDACSRDDNFVADTGHMKTAIRELKGIQVDTSCIQATCIKCKRGIANVTQRTLPGIRLTSFRTLQFVHCSGDK